MRRPTKNRRYVSMALLAAGLVLVHRTTIAQVVTTLAGSGATGSADGSGVEASFSYPQGVAVGPSGNVYVADTNSLKIRKITPQGLVTTLAGNGLSGYEDGIGTQARFYGPLGVAADASGNVWVADQDDGFGDGQYMKKIRPDGVVVNMILYPGFNPIALAVDDSGSLYVLDLDGSLWKISTDLRWSLLTTVVPSPYASFSTAWGVAVDGAANVYFSGRDKIQKITPDGTVTTLAGSGNPGSADGAGTSASFRGPKGLAVDSSGNVYVADRGNNTIRKVTSSGIVTTLAGSASPGTADGTGTAASFNSPAGVALDSSGNLYVADSGNNKIRKITFTGDSNEACVANATTLCLQHSRYKVQAQWFTGDGASGVGQVIPLTPDTGAFWFFNSSNVEMLVKVLNGCGLNSRYWTFAGGLTDVNVILTVTDTQTGALKTYINPSGTPFQPIQDTSAFATCP